MVVVLPVVRGVVLVVLALLLGTVVPALVDDVVVILSGGRGTVLVVLPGVIVVGPVGRGLVVFVTLVVLCVVVSEDVVPVEVLVMVPGVGNVVEQCWRSQHSTLTW